MLMQWDHSSKFFESIIYVSNTNSEMKSVDHSCKSFTNTFQKLTINSNTLHDSLWKDMAIDQNEIQHSIFPFKLDMNILQQQKNLSFIYISNRHAFPIILVYNNNYWNSSSDFSWQNFNSNP